MSDCNLCGGADGAADRMGKYRMTLCQSCAISPSASDGFGNYPEAEADIERRRFSDGLADLAKVLERAGRRE